MLLVVVLVMVVALTVGLSVIARTTTNIRTTGEEEKSQRAFSAAEAGIERAILDSADIPTTQLSNNTSYTTDLSTSSDPEFVLNNGTVILKDEPIDVWLSDYSPVKYANPRSGNLTINWGNASDVCSSGSNNTMSALEIILISGTTVNPKVTTYAFDPCSARGTCAPSPGTGNHFCTPTYGEKTIDGQTFVYNVSIPVTSGLLARIIPLYAPTFVGVEGSFALPQQGTFISSVGVSDTTKRKIVSFRGYPKLPVELFPFIIFSPKQ